MLDTNAGGAVTKKKQKICDLLGKDWTSKKIALAFVVFLLPMGPLLLFTFLSVKHVLREIERKRLEKANGK